MKIDALDYIPHSGAMALIDDIIAVGEKFIECSVNTKRSEIFADKNNNIPGWLVIEYMAQTIGAFAGWHDRQAGLPVKLGFLLGCRKLNIDQQHFSNDENLRVRAEIVFKDEKLGSFKCSISPLEDERIIAEATINVYQPENIEEFLKEQKK